MSYLGQILLKFNDLGTYFNSQDDEQKFPEFCEENFDWFFCSPFNVKGSLPYSHWSGSSPQAFLVILFLHLFSIHLKTLLPCLPLSPYQPLGSWHSSNFPKSTKWQEAFLLYSLTLHGDFGLGLKVGQWSTKGNIIQGMQGRITGNSWFK